MMEKYIQWALLLPVSVYTNCLPTSNKAVRPQSLTGRVVAPENKGRGCGFRRVDEAMKQHKTIRIYTPDLARFKGPSGAGITL